MANKRKAKVRSDKPMGGPGSTLAWIIPNATVFISSGCIMVIELVAGRLIARHLGSSLYTWTSVIGVVLAGIAIGNYIGGRLADRFPARRTLALLFILSSAASAGVTFFEGAVGNWTPLWSLSWPMRVASHVTLVFFVPSGILGMISPVVAKMALDLGRQTGRTIGSVYAWGVVGSILGTFVTGFVLIDLMGTIAVVWSVAAVLAVMGILYLIRSWTVWSWTAVLALWASVANGPWGWAQTVGEALTLRKPPNPNVLYSNESQYSFIEILQVKKSPDVRAFHLDTLLHSQIDMDNPANFLYAYEKICAAISHRLSKGKARVHSLTIGGAGYVYPRYMDATWPGGPTEVVEIDPATTEAAMIAFGLPRDTEIICHHEDGRVMIDRLVRRKNSGEPVDLFDFVYCDAVNDYSVPYQLTSKEFMQKIREILSPDGAYLMNMIDIYDSGRLLGALVTTMETVFPHVSVFVEGIPVAESGDIRNTFIIAGLNQPFDAWDLGSEYDPTCEIFALTPAEMETLRQRSGGIVLTDDYAPVENLLAPVVKDAAAYRAASEWVIRARRETAGKHYQEALDQLEGGLRRFPDSLIMRNEMGYVLLAAGRLEEAAAVFEGVLQEKPTYVEARVGLASALKRMGQTDRAIEAYETAVKQNPADATVRYNLAGLLAEKERYDEAIEHYRIVVNIRPTFVADAYNNWATVLLKQGNREAAVEKLTEAVAVKPDHGEAQFNLAHVLSLLGRYEEAGRNWQEVLAREPDNAQAHNGYGKTLFRLERFDEALVEYRRAVTTAPNLADAHFSMAVILDAQGRLDEAGRACERACRLKPKDEQAKKLLEHIRQRQ